MINVKVALENKKVYVISIEYKNITLAELADEINIDKKQIGAILVNGVPKKFTDKIEDNSNIYILPILAGG